MEDLVRRDAEFAARNDRLQGRMSTHRYEDMAGPDASAGFARMNRLRIRDHGAAVDVLDPGLLQFGPVDPLQRVDLPVLVADQGRQIEASLADAPAESLRLMKLV